LIAWFVTYAGCGPNSVYTRIKLSENYTFDVLLLDHSLEVLSSLLYTQCETCVDKGELLNPQ